MHANTPLDKRIPYLEDRVYLENDLGLSYHPTHATFKVWSPTAKEAWLNVYTTANTPSLYKKVPLTREDTVWTVTLKEDLKGFFYTYSFIHAPNQDEVEAADVYSRAVGLNGNRTAIIPLSETNPDKWEEDSFKQVASITDALIWEVHIEDFSSDQSAHFSKENRGKYRAFTEDSVYVNDDPTQLAGVSYLKDLGINYVHLLPAFDFENDELAQIYNWGYDPKNFLVPEGKYASDPRNPVARIKEFKEMVAHIHKQGIGVILDVVFNHTFFFEEAWFQRTVPGYYYRFKKDGSLANGSGTGNETASERKMMRKYIIDAVLYWVEEYHIDGFRFDLMGLHDVATMNLLRKALDDHGHERVLLYGEPWSAGGVSIYEPNKPADKYHIEELVDGIAVFNDDFRDAIKGPVFDKKKGAFLQGMNGHPGSIYSNTDLIASILANTQSDVGRFRLPDEKKWARNPSQVVTYASAHDNLTFYDKLVATQKTTPSYQRDLDLIQLNKIHAALLFTSLGGIFFQAGEEWGRTKFGNENSYQASIDVNMIDWSRTYENRDLVQYYKGMIQIRQAYSPLRDPSNKTGDAVTFSQLRENLLAYTIPNTTGNSPWKMMAVVVNTNKESERVSLRSRSPLPKEWTIIANRHTAGLNPLGTVLGNHFVINPKEVLILVSE